MKEERSGKSKRVTTSPGQRGAKRRTKDAEAPNAPPLAGPEPMSAPEAPPNFGKARRPVSYKG